MRISALIPILAALIPPLSQAQESDDFPPCRYPTVTASGQQHSDFVPRDWRVLASAAGDLNNDGKADVALVLQGNDAAYRRKNDGLGESEIDANPRMLVLALSNAHGGFNKLLQNNAFIPPHDNPVADDPFDGIAIERGLLMVSFRLSSMSAGTWDTSTTRYAFRYQQQAMTMTGYDYNYFHRGSGEERSISANLSTGRRRMSRTGLETGKATVSWKRMDARQIPSLERIHKDGISQGLVLFGD